MRILVSTPTFFPIVGGAELLIRDVLNVWSEQHDVRLVTPVLKAGSAPFWSDADVEATCDFEVVRFRDRVNLMDLRGHAKTKGVVPPMSLSAVPELSRQVRDFDADALVTFFGAPYGLPAAIVARRAGIPHTIVFCGTDIPSPRTAVAPVWHSYLRLAASSADRAVYVSRFCFDALFPARRFTSPHDVVIHGGIPLAERSEREKADATRRCRELRGRLDVGDEDVMLFSLSRLGPEKRVDVLLRAFAALPPLPRRVRLVIGGQGSEADSLRELADELGITGDVVFTGLLGAEKADYYEACDVFVFHSMFETFGQVLVEAMTAGKPVVSVRAGAIPEVVGEGEAGLLAEPADAEDVAARIADLVRDDDLRHEMGAAARRRVEQLFDWNAARQRWIQLLDTEPRNEASRFATVADRERLGAKAGSS